MSPEQARGAPGCVGAALRTFYRLGRGHALLPADRQAACVRGRRRRGRAAGPCRRAISPTPRAVDPSIDRRWRRCVSRRWRSPPRRTATRHLAHWPTTSSGGWPTSRSRPGPSRSPKRARRWMRRRRTAVTAAAAALVVATLGLASVLAVQARANGAEESQHPDPGPVRSALEAIKTFHTGVSEDVLLTNDNLKPVRDRLLKDATEFYKRPRSPALGPVRPGIAEGSGTGVLRDGQAGGQDRRD